MVHQNIRYKALPLLVRPNSIIAEGKAEGQIVYDYGKNVTLKVYEMEEGVLAPVRSLMPDAEVY